MGPPQRRRILFVEDEGEMYIYLHEHDDGWEQYILKGTPYAGFAEMRTFGPWAITDYDDVTDFAAIVLSILRVI
ncbi:hypothetical protein BO71DRAFT_436345 [Aspergillus ellipticus CBS 707.79]|uniref:Uncharacterized protein n=1 Tax=Aspergillus ellipticus CBS 707.79 TaxID=1448320 RepID=A0A319CTI9_9EURO|nr:hypothetical protein BO71DRAFT_436345 [Aspergillus ellipticus CBS 707.79]